MGAARHDDVRWAMAAAVGLVSRQRAIGAALECLTVDERRAVERDAAIVFLGEVEVLRA